MPLPTATDYVRSLGATWAVPHVYHKDPQVDVGGTRGYNGSQSPKSLKTPHHV